MKNPWQAVLGQERLWVVFWLYCLVGTVVVALLLAMSGLPPPAITTALAVAFMVYVLWAHYSLWTCAFNTKWRPWGYAARVYACVAIAGIAFSSFVEIKSGPIDVLQP